MATATERQSSALAHYQLHLPQFEGPLDVLLRLIERSQLAINDLSLVRVTEEFLVHVRTLDEQAPPEVIAEFTAVGARLTLLKSRSLLPHPSVDDEDENPSELTRQLEDYRRCKEMAGELSTRFAAGAASFGPDTARIVWRDSRPARLAHYDAAVLIRAIRRRLSALPRPTETLRQRPVVTLPQMIDRIVSYVRHGTVVPFGHVLTTCRGRSEAATAFLALLVLHRRRVIAVRQDELFGEIDLAQCAPSTAVWSNIHETPVATEGDLAMTVPDQNGELVNATV